MSLPALHPVQIAYHVPDPQRAAETFAEQFGWGPFFLMEHIPLSSCLYRGRPQPFDHTSAYGQAGELMVELICQHGEGISVLRDMYSATQIGVHHVASFVQNLEDALTAFAVVGAETAMLAKTADGVQFAMVDTRGQFGHMVELYERRADLDRFYSYVRRKSEGWDGSTPLRRLNP